jgi:hypothetical protein
VSIIENQFAAAGHHAELLFMGPMHAWDRPTAEAYALAMRAAHDAFLHRVRKCKAEDCERTFVRDGRREFCSTRCQKRVYMREMRAKA